jgi:cysteine desulfurase
MEPVYLDNNATTRPDAAVVAEMQRVLQSEYGNPSSLHRLGQSARHTLDQARQRVASLVGAAPSEIIFTSGGTESINTALRGLFQARRPRPRIVTSSTEHAATRGACDALRALGAEIVELPVSSSGELNLPALQAELSRDPALVSLLWANNETGVLFDVPAIAALCRAAKVPFHCDATQAVGKLPLNVHDLALDAMTFTAHKIHGPKGAGALYLRRGLRLEPLIPGGPQESSRRGGTEPLPAIAGFAIAADLAASALAAGDMQRIRQLRDRLETGLLTAVPGAQVSGAAAPRLPNTTNIGFPRLEADAILLLLSERGVCASAGAACSSGSLEPSHVLQAMKVHPHLAHGSIRLSLSRFTTSADIDHALAIIPNAIARLQQTLPIA